MAKINKRELLNAFKNDLRESERHQKDWYVKRSEYLSQTTGLPYGNEDPNKSSIVSKDILKQLNWMLPSLTSPFLGTTDIIKCNPVTYEDVDSAKQNELLLNTQFCRKFNRYNFIMKGARVLASEGTLVVQTGWDYQDEEVEVEREVVLVDELTGLEYIDVETVIETKVLKNQPTAVVCRNEDIFIDPTCMDDMDKCQFVIHRYESSLSALKEDGRYKNLDKLEREDHTLNEANDYYREDTTYFEFKDKARKKFVVHEYWGNYDINNDGELEPIVCAWVNNTIVRLEANPYPDKKPPFIVVPFNAVPFQMFGEALAENIGDNQKVKTAITRGIIDNMAKSTNGQIGIRKGALDQSNKKKFLSDKNFEFNGTPNDIWEGSYNSIPGSAFDMLSMMNNEIESQTGVKSFSGGINGNSLGSSATGARGALDATSTRRLNMVRNMAENWIKPLLRKWMSYNSEFLEEEEIIRITNEEYVPVRRDDLMGNIDIDMAISTAEDNAGKVEQLSFLLQTLGNTMPFEMTQTVLADIVKLSEMPELEKNIRDFKQQPNPQQERLQEIELQRLILENKKLEADIMDKQARASENTVDAEYKRWKAESEKAKARKLGSEADVMDINFFKENEGIKHKEKLELDSLKYKANLAQMAFQASQNDTNLGVMR